MLPGSVRLAGSVLRHVFGYRNRRLTNDNRVVTRRTNHRGWIVLESIAASDGTLCVDLVEDPAGGFGFEHLRADPEDRGRWTVVGGFGTQRYDDAIAAAHAALEAVTWLRVDAAAHRSWNRWMAELLAD